MFKFSLILTLMTTGALASPIGEELINTPQHTTTPLSLEKIPHDGTFGVILEKLPLLDVYNLARSRTEYWDNPEFWEEVKNTRPGRFNDAMTAVQLAKYMKTHFPELIQNGGQTLFQNAEFMAKVDIAYTPEFARGIRAFLQIISGDFNGGIALLNTPNTITTSKMHEKLQEALNNLYSVIDDHIAAQNYLEGVVANIGNSEQVRNHAQVILNNAARMGQLKFTNMSDTERQTYLEDIVADATNPGRLHAQILLNSFANNGQFEFSEYTLEERRAYLESIVADTTNPGRQHAQEKLNYAALKGELKFSSKTPKERQTYLEQIVADTTNPGRQHAQAMLNSAAIESMLEFKSKTPKERQTYLERIVADATNPGRQHAQWMLNSAAENKGLGFKTMNEKERIQYLQKIASDPNNPGQQNARGRLMSPDEIREKASMGDTDMQLQLEGNIQRIRQKDLFFALYNTIIGMYGS